MSRLPRSPSSLERPAKQGTTFVNAFAPMARMTPALGLLMTGLWPHQHGSREVRTLCWKGASLPLASVLPCAIPLSRFWNTR
jgi:arylsulfatase A-like enzyme